MSEPKVKRIARYLDNRTRAFDFEQIQDPRARRGRRWSLRSLLMATVVGMVAMKQTFRGVERITDRLCGCRKRLRIPRRVPDSTLARFYARFDDEPGLRNLLVEDIQRARRRKALEPTALPVTTVAIDGKTIWCGKHQVDDPACQKLSREGEGTFRLHALHAVLISVSSQPCIDQMLVPRETNEMGALPDFLDNLTSAYEAKTPWVHYRGKRIRRELFRSGEIQGWPNWESARQVWRMKQTTKHASGTVTVENRYFVTSLPWDRLTAQEILNLVRLHWGVENGCHWTLDVVLGEDERPWCTKGRALRMLSWLRLLAYNTLRFLRDRYLRSDSSRRQPWAELGEDIVQALKQASAWRGVGSAEATQATL